MFRKKNNCKKGSIKNRGFMAAAVCLGTIFYAMPVFASGMDSVTKPIDQLRTLFIAIASGIGIIMIVKNIIELGTAISQQDSASMRMALLGLVGGAMIAAAGALLAFLGF